jgi:glutathione-specific gamma-glutamylcyclotransferase
VFLWQERMEWDADLGVWKGSKASAFSEIPNPLYIFGYGSLLWRPGDLLSKYSATPCVCYGWKRLFAQRSMDHRGTTQFPGFVATLVSDAFFHENNNDSRTESPSECVGIAFLVPNEDIDELIAELDYREKGGYHRHVISVKLLEKTLHHNQFDLANALVYTGPTDNPNFSLEFSIQNWETLISRIIAISVGPSGENAEYLLQLAAFVGQQLQHDEYLEKLARVVFNTMCPWRGRLLLQRCNQFSDGTQTQDLEMVVSPNQVEIVESVDFEKKGPLLLAWGSNESYQLSGIESFQFHFQSSPFHLSRDPSSDSSSSFSQDHLIMTPTHFGTFSSTIPQLIVNKNELYNPTLFHYQVYAGGSRSAIQCHTHLYLWGDITSIPNDQSQTNTEVKHQIKCWKKTFYLSEVTSEDSSQRLMISQEEVLAESLIIPSNAHSISHSYETMTFTGVESVAMGHHHNLILSHDRTSVLAFGDDEYHQCSDMNSSFLLQASLSSFPSTKLTVAKLSVGLHHSALITTSGLVYTWGDASYGQSLPENMTPWKAPPITKNELRYCGVIPRVMDICCGAHHTVLLDTIGRVYTFGSNRYFTHFLVKSFSSFSLSVDTGNLAERSSPLKKQMVKELKRRKDLESAAIFQQK